VIQSVGIYPFGVILSELPHNLKDNIIAIVIMTCVGLVDLMMLNAEADAIELVKLNSPT